MFSYTRFDFIQKTKKTKILKIIVNIIIISFILIIVLFNIDTKADVKIISSNSRRIINTLNNYTETMGDFMVSSNEINEMNEINELKNIRLSINYFKDLKEKEIKQEELKKEEIKQKELKERELTEQKIKEQELKDKKERAIKLIKSYIPPNYNPLINLGPSHFVINGYSNNFNCLQRLIKINSEELFNSLIKIDYENNEVSFNYLDKNEEYYKNTNNIKQSHLYTNYDENNRYYNYSHYIYHNYKENIIKNPIYQIIKNNLEIDPYTEPNLTDEYNNKSKYFQQSTFFQDNYYKYNLTHYGYNNNYYKYYETRENDTQYLYYKITNKYNNTILVYYNYYIELLIKNKIFINNPNSIDIYNKHSYKFICNIPSKTTITRPSITRYNLQGTSSFIYRCYKPECKLYNSNIYKNNIEDILNTINDISYYNNKKENIYYYRNIGDNDYDNYEYYSSSYINYELDKNKGTRMIKHNLTNNLDEYYSIFMNLLEIDNYYFNNYVYIDFPLITIYDEYEYIKVILSNITPPHTHIFYLPIIPPIKFI